MTVGPVKEGNLPSLFSALFMIITTTLNTPIRSLSEITNDLHQKQTATKKKKSFRKINKKVGGIELDERCLSNSLSPSPPSGRVLNLITHKLSCQRLATRSVWCHTSRCGCRSTSATRKFPANEPTRGAGPWLILFNAKVAKGQPRKKKHLVQDRICTWSRGRCTTRRRGMSI